MHPAKRRNKKAGVVIKATILVKKARLVQEAEMSQATGILADRNQVAEVIKAHGNRALQNRNQIAVSNYRIFVSK